MNPQEYNNNPHNMPPQPDGMPGPAHQPGGAQPSAQSHGQPGAFVGGPGIDGAGQYPTPQMQTPEHQPYPPQHPQPQPYHHNPAAQPPPAPHGAHGQWQQPPQPSSYPMPPAQNKKLIAIIIATVVVLLVGVGVFFLMKGDNPVSNLTNSINGNSDVVDRSDGTLDLSNLIDPVETIKSQDIKAKINQQINLSDGSSYMVASVERNWTHSELKASSGKELIKINVVVGNKAKEGGLYFSDNFFRLKNSAGGLQDAEYVTPEEVPDILVGGEVAPGKQLKGSIIYEVDKDEQLGGLLTEDTYTKSSSDEEITIKSEVAL